MAKLKGSKTEDNLKAAFAGESQANRRYLYFAQKADVEGYNDVAAVFRSTAEGETGHAHGHLEFLEEVGDPATGEPIGNTGAEPQGRDRRRDARIHRHVSGHGPHRARGRLRRDRRLVRDAGQGREVARRQVPEDAERTAEVSRVRGPTRTAAPGTPHAERSGEAVRDGRSLPDAPRIAASARTGRLPRHPAMREGSLERADPPSDRLAGRRLLRRGQARRRAAPRLRHLSRLPALLQSVRLASRGCST